MIPKIKAGDRVIVARQSSIFTPQQTLGCNGYVLEIYKNPNGEGDIASISLNEFFIKVPLCDLEFFEGSQFDAD
jgi:hypothetical protein